MSAYDCSQCPGYCCSYPVIAVTRKDVERLARHFGIEPDIADKRFTKRAYGEARVLRRKADPIYGRICRFFDQQHRRCGIYRARPRICRTFPGPGRCGYYEFLTFERETQNDPDHIALTSSGDWR